MVKNRRERGAQHRRDRSAPHRHRGGRRPASADRARHGHRAVLRPARASRRRGALDYALHRRATPPASTNALARARDDRARPRRDRAARPACREPTSRASSSCSRATPNASSPAISQGVNQSAQGTDKVNAIINCHLATGRIGKPGHGAVLAHRPAQRHGRARGRRARQPARRAHGLRAAETSTACGRFWKAPRIADARGPQGGADVRGDRARQDQGAVGDGDQSRRSRCRARDAVRDALGKLELFVVSENVVVERHRRLPARTFCCRPRPGARRTARSPIPSGASRASARSCRRPARRKPDWWIVTRGGAARMGFGAAFAYRIARPTSSASTRRSRRSRTTARATSTSARSRDVGRQRLSTRSRRCNGRAREAMPHGDSALLRRRRLLHARPQGALRRARAARAGARDRRATSRCALNTGRVRDQWHTMTRIGPEPAARRASARAVRRGASGRRRGERASSTAASRSVTTRWGSCVLKVERQRRRSGAARFSRRFTGAMRRASAARIGDLVMPRDRSAIPASPTPRRRRRRSRRSTFAFRGFALTRRAARVARRHLVGARRAGAGGYGLLLASNDGPAAWRERARAMFGDDAELAEFVRRAARHLPRRGVRRRTARRLPVHRPRRGARRNGTRSRRCSKPGRSTTRQRRVLLSGHSADGLASAGPIVCACFGVGLDHHPRRAPVGHGDQRRRASARRCAPAPIAAPACRSSSASLRMRRPRWRVLARQLRRHCHRALAHANRPRCHRVVPRTARGHLATRLCHPTFAGRGSKRCRRTL